MRIYMKNIGKIKEADIEIKGITVIGGENNAGKSTVAKALFSVFNCFYEIQTQIHLERLLSIGNALKMIYHNIYLWVDTEFKDIEECSEKILSKSAEYIKSPENLKKDIIIMLKLEELSKKVQEKIEIDDIVDRIVDSLKISDEVIFDSLANKKVNAEFSGQLLNIQSMTEGIISLYVKNEELSIKVFKDGVSVGNLDYSLHTQAVYIDDPFVLDRVDIRMFRRNQSYFDHSDQLIYKLTQSGHGSVVDEIVVENRFRRIFDKLSQVCDGNIVKQKNGHLGYRIGNADSVLNVNNLSTGLKTFAILKTLLTNGEIDANGTIILDEPEIHLHPEWQLVFAELIVMLNVEFGANILLNTHSPYFLRAIQVYAAKYNKNDVCKYYLADVDKKDRASFIDVSENVDKIFEKLAKPLQKLEDERWDID